MEKENKEQRKNRQIKSVESKNPEINLSYFISKF